MFGQTTDNEKTMEVTFESEIRNGCFSHIESKACQYALDSSDRLKNTRKKLRKVAKKANKSSKFKSFIEKEQIKRNLKTRTLKQEIKTRFTATHTMARSFMNDPNEKKSEAPIDEGKVMENIEAVNAALKSSVKKGEYNRLYIDHSDVTVLLNIVPTLDPMEEAITYLGGDKHITASSVLPFLVNFNTFLETNEDDPLYVTKFKSTLKREMIERCVKHLNF